MATNAEILKQVEQAAREVQNPWYPEVTRCFQTFADNLARIRKEARPLDRAVTMKVD